MERETVVEAEFVFTVREIGQDYVMLRVRFTDKSGRVIEGVLPTEHVTLRRGDTLTVEGIEFTAEEEQKVGDNAEG